jgi:sugar phosphate isomerase/epimerase
MTRVKGRYPWRIGATSFVIPAGIAENVAYLAGLVDDIQLLFFESSCRSRLPQRLDVPLLAALARDHQLSFTVHLPTDLQPGHGSKAVRQEARDEIVRLMTELAPLHPQRFDLHLPRRPELEEAAWLAHIDDFLLALKMELGPQSMLVAVENIDYPFSLVAPLVRHHGFDLCADIGHCLFFQDDPLPLLQAIHPASHLHYHGIRGGRDHQALGPEQRDCTARLGAALHAGGHRGVVTLEVYNSGDLRACLQHIAQIWTQYQQGKNF